MLNSRARMLIDGSIAVNILLALHKVSSPPMVSIIRSKYVVATLFHANLGAMCKFINLWWFAMRETLVNKIYRCGCSSLTQFTNADYRPDVTQCCSFTVPHCEGFHGNDCSWCVDFFPFSEENVFLDFCLPPRPLRRCLLLRVTLNFGC